MEEDTRINVTCPHCYAYIKVEAENELYVCPVCRRSFTDEDVLLALEKESD